MRNLSRLLVVLIVLVATGCASPPTDAEIISDYQEHRALFHAAVAELSGESHFMQVGIKQRSGGPQIAVEPADFDVGRIPKTMELLRLGKVRSVSRGPWEEPVAGIAFGYHSSGLAVSGGLSKVLAYSADDVPVPGEVFVKDTDVALANRVNGASGALSRVVEPHWTVSVE